MNLSKLRKTIQACISLITILFMLFSPLGNGFRPVLAQAPGSQKDTSGPLSSPQFPGAPNPLMLTDSSMNENIPAGTSVGLFSVADPNEAFIYTYTLVDGEGSADNSAFTISGDSLNIIASPDYETKNSYSIRVRVTDNQDFPFQAENTFTLMVNDLNEAPTGILLSSLSISENVAAGSLVGTLTALDPEQTLQTFTYSLVDSIGSADNAAFSITGNNLTINASLDYEARASYSIRVQVLDSGSPAMSFEQVLTITVSDLNELPTSLTLSANTIVENAPENARTIGTFSATDPDLPAQTLTYTLVDGTGALDNAAFAITGSTLSVKAAPDYETRPYYSIRVRVTDSGTPSQFYEKFFQILVTNIIEPPIVSSFERLGSMDTPIQFTQTDFLNHFYNYETPGSKDPVRIKITGLPAHGTLHFGSGPSLAEGAEILFQDLLTLLYTPVTAYSGSDRFTWNANNNLGYASQDAQVSLTIGSPASRGLRIDPPSDGKSSITGSAMYNFLLTNTGNVPDGFTLSLDGDSSWPSAISPTHVSSLAPGASAYFSITVTIPPSAQKDSSVETRIKVVSDSDPAITAPLKLTTTNTYQAFVPGLAYISPFSSPYSPTQRITANITGVNFTNPMTVTFSGQQLTVLQSSNPRRIKVVLPVGLAIGDYLVQACNAASQCATLSRLFTVRPTFPRVTGVVPAQGSSFTSNRVLVYGDNLEKVTAFTLFSSTYRVNLQPELDDWGQVTIKIPAGLPSDSYGLEYCTNTDGCAVQFAVYSSLPLNASDFYAYPDDLFFASDPIRSGSSIRMSLYVRSSGVDERQVEVAFYHDDPTVPGNLIPPGIVLTPTMTWGSMNTISVIWDPPSGRIGPVKIYAMIDPDGKLTEASKTNNTVIKEINILPPVEEDSIPPLISEFKVTGGLEVTLQPRVTLSLLASDDPKGAGVKNMILTERVLNTASRVWSEVSSSGWIPYASTISYTLSDYPGIHYLEARVSDGNGNVSLMAQTSINYGPVINSMDAGQVAVFRLGMSAGDTRNVLLIPQTGDADLYIWGPDSRLLAVSLQAGQTTEQVTFKAPVMGTYQVEIVAHTDTSAAIKLAAPAPTSAGPSAASLQSGEKTPRTRPAVLTADLPLETNPTDPAPIDPPYLTFLPVLRR